MGLVQDETQQPEPMATQQPNEDMTGNPVDQAVMQGAMAQQGALPPISQFEQTENI